MLYRRRPPQILAVLALIFLSSAGLRAQDNTGRLSTEPILRIETGKHGAQINRIDTDAANRFAVTASDDKTVRIWSLPDGRPLRVLRLPVGEGNIGKAYAVAISPDGATVAAGGWTSPSDRSENVYLFDRASGEVKQRLGGLPNVVHSLVYSADGRRLAASLGGRNGIRVFDASNGYRPMASDAQYGDKTYSAAFDRAGRLVTASYDGFVRLYAADHYDTPIARFDSHGHRPHTVAFSPDGARIAVGHDDIKELAVLSARDLRELYRPDTTGIPNVGFTAVGWSADGRFLFAGGQWSVDGKVEIRRWSDNQRQTPTNIPSASNTIMEIVALKGGQMLFASTKSFGVIQTDGKPLQLQGYGAIELNSGRGPLRASKTGDVVQVDSWEPYHTYRFALSRRQIDVDPATDASLRAPTTEAPGLSVSNWYDSTAPAVNGKPLGLDAYERSQSLAIVPGSKKFVIGADWSLRLFDENAHEVWPALAVPGVVWHVNVTADGRLIVAALGDGTIRWYRVSDGGEVLALFIHPDGQRWILWTPQGYYDASAGADELIGWQINHGFDRAPDFYPVSQFRERYYRPDVIRRLLKTPNLDVARAVREADDTVRAAGGTVTRAAPVGSLLTPVVAIDDPKDQAREDHTDLELAYTVRMPSPSDPLRVEALIDGVKAPAEEHRLVDKGDTRAGILHIRIPRRDSKISVIAYNDNGPSVPASVQVKWAGPGTEPKLTLYVLAIGISHYRAADKDPRLRLQFAAKDADDFVALAKAQTGGLYDKVIPYPQYESLTNKKATRDAVLDGLDWITHAVTNTNDVAMIFLAGHGISTPDRHYRFLPYNYDPDHIERTTISDEELKDYLTKIGGKKIFFFDTCYSGDVLRGRGPDTRPNVDEFANQLRASANGIVVFTSSTGDELSQEKPEWNNGAFTKAVIEGMRGAAARREVPVIMISDLQGYISRRVKELTKGNQRPMMAMPATVEDFPVAERLN